ncbi:MAG: hypothetical protein GYB66_06935 [Chloroflexi bacterium]|nr:hypothetical protein [Chloroflexota bacterium]
MQAIPAANYLNIEFGPDFWRLVSHELDTPTTLLDASPEGLLAHPVFRAARSLPSATIAPAQIIRIIMGWAPESQAWRLGLLLVDGSVTKIDTTQMQWCELAAWAESEQPDVYQARLAGQALARLINRPFQFLEPHAETRVSVFNPDSPEPPVETISLAEEIAAPDEEDDALDTAMDAADDTTNVTIPEIVPPDLPLRFAGWQLTRSSVGLRWRRTQSWWLFTLGKLLLFGVLGVLFLLLSIGSQTRGLAEVEPPQLTQIGVLVSIALLVSLVYTLWQLLSASAVVINTFEREVYSQGLLFPFIYWRVPFDRIQYLLVTQTPPQPQGRRRRTDPMQITQDFWLHVYDGADFHEIIDLPDVPGQSWTWDKVRTQGHSQVRRSLQLAHYDTPAHHASQQIAHLIGVPVYLDLV